MTALGHDMTRERSAAENERQPHQSEGFRTILFPPGTEQLRDDHDDQPAYFVDLNLDQIVAAIVAKRDEATLRPLFYSPYRSEEIVRYRQAVFADLERPDVFRLFPTFCDTMRTVRANLAYAGKVHYRRHQQMVILRAIDAYCEAITSLLRGLQSLSLRSAGLRDFQRYVANYAASDVFMRLEKDTHAMRRVLFEITYSMLFRGDKVTVREYASELDYTVTVLDRFAKFRETAVEPPAPTPPKDDFGLNHIEGGILEFVGRLFPQQFRSLDDYVDQHSTFIDEVMAQFDREIGFFVAYLAFIAPLRKGGLPFCRPDVSISEKASYASASFDLALASKFAKDGQPVVTNSFNLSGPERLIVVSGPNQGGKTTFARMFGQLHFLAELGCPIPGKRARLFLPDQLFSHFEREEDITNLRGKLEDELVRLHQSLEAMTADSVIILNEIFNSTGLEDQVFLGTRVLEAIQAIDAIGVCVTFIDGLSTLSAKTVSMVSTVVPDDPARRTFEVVRKAADGLAYALSLAEKHGVTYDRLRTRVRP
jgi:DNA mismatch repair protein MutS